MLTLVFFHTIEYIQTNVVQKYVIFKNTLEKASISIAICITYY